MRSRAAFWQRKYGLRQEAMPCANCHFEPGCTILKAHRERVEAGSSGDIARRDDRWSESIAVGSERFVEQVKI
jgi:hypothetical protein